jgi:hypothetical protein
MWTDETQRFVTSSEARMSDYDCIDVIREASATVVAAARGIKKSWGYSGDKMSRNFSEQDEHKVKPHVLRTLRKHMAVVVHCERGHRKALLPPLEPDGSVSR